MKVTIEQAMKVATGKSQMHSDDTVLRFANRTTPLSLHVRRFISLFDIARFIDDGDRAWAGMLGPHDLMHALAHAIFVPLMRCQELLQGRRSDPARSPIGSQLLAGRSDS